jgi:hypothetical protein
MKRSITFDTVREMGLAMPDVEEGTSYGTPALKMKGKLVHLSHVDRDALRDLLFRARQLEAPTNKPRN